MWCKTEWVSWQEVCRFNTVRIGYSTRSYKMYKTPSSNYKQHTSEGRNVPCFKWFQISGKKQSVLMFALWYFCHWCNLCALAGWIEHSPTRWEPLETWCILSPRWIKQIYQECFLLSIRSHVACVLVIVSGSAVETQTWPGAAPLVMWPPSSMPSGSENGRGRRVGKSGIRIERGKKESERKGDKCGKRCGNEKVEEIIVNQYQKCSVVLCMFLCI